MKVKSIQASFFKINNDDNGITNLASSAEITVKTTTFLSGSPNAHIYPGVNKADHKGYLNGFQNYCSRIERFHHYSIEQLIPS